MTALNSQVDNILQGNETTAAITSNTVDTGHIAPASRAKKVVLSPEAFAHRPGQSEIEFNKLTMQEFVLGNLRICCCGQVAPEESQARLRHMMDIMIYASAFKWSSVRALYGVVLHEIKVGLRQWSDPLSNLKDEMLRSQDLISKSTTDTHQICHQWNYAQCPRGNSCAYLHVCKDCDKYRNKEEHHQAKTCPHKTSAS